MAISELEKRLAVFEIGKSNNKPYNMNVYRNERNLDGLKNLADNLKKLKTNFEDMINNYDTISDYDFYKKYCTLYYTNNDELKKVYFNGMFKNPKMFALKTNDYTSFQMTEGHGRDFSYWYNWYKCAYKVIAEQSEKFDLDKVYTKQELLELANNGTILLTGDVLAYGEECPETTALKEKKEQDKIKLPVLTLHRGFSTWSYYLKESDFKEMYKQNKPAFVAIKQNLSKQQLQEDYKKFIKAYVITMNNITSAIKNYIKEATKDFNEEKKEFYKQKEKANKTITMIEENKDQNI